MNFPCSAARSATTTSWLIRPIIAATHQASVDRARRQATVAASAPRITRAAAADSAVLRAPGRSTRGTRLSTTLPWSSGMGKTRSDCASSPTSPSAIDHRYGLRNRASSRRSGAVGPIQEVRFGHVDQSLALPIRDDLAVMRRRPALG